MDALLSTPLSPLSPFIIEGKPSFASKRQKIVREIYESEQTYMSQISTIVELFLKPVRAGGYLSQSNISAIFSNIEGILAVNTELLNYMKQSSLGDAFLYLGPFLKLYGSYSSNYQTAINILEKCLKTDARFNEFILTQESRPECNYLNLSSLLIVPVQRIPRYKLLLDDLLKHTKQTHIEYSKINSAVQQISAVATYINEYIRLHENAQKMISIQSSLTGGYVPVIITPGRQFIREGKMMKVCRKKPKERMVYLFTDILLYARSNIFDVKPDSYISRGILPLINAQVKVELNDRRLPNNTVTLKLTTEDNNTLILFSTNEQLTFEWAETIQTTILELNNETAKQPTIQLAPIQQQKKSNSPRPRSTESPPTGQIQLAELAFPPETEQPNREATQQMQLEELGLPTDFMETEPQKEGEEDIAHEMDSLIATSVKSGTPQSRCCVIC